MSGKNTGENTPLAEAAFEQGNADGSTVTIPADQAQGDDNAPPSTPEPQGQYFTAEDIEKARKQEKDKLYGRLEKLQTQVESFAEMTKRQEDEKAQELRSQEEQRRAQELEEMSAKDAVKAIEDELNTKLQSMSTEYEERLRALQAQMEAKDAQLEKERELSEITHYRSTLMQQYGDDIHPQLRDLVSGNTKEELEASISSLVERSNAIMESASQALQPQRVRGVPATGGSTTGPVETQTETQTLSADDIRNMSLQDYERMRDRLLQQARPR